MPFERGSLRDHVKPYEGELLSKSLSIVLYCTVLYCTVLYCTVLYRTVL
jgi:hypothetical protein